MKLFVVYKAFKMATLILLFQNDSIFNLSLVNDEILSVLVTSIPFFSALIWTNWSIHTVTLLHSDYSYLTLQIHVRTKDNDLPDCIKVSK